MSFTTLRCPTENQIGAVIIITLIILGIVGLYYAIQFSDEQRVEYELFLTDMKCETLEFQALNHEYESYRSIALKEHGGRC